jgi:hypothetical protein
MPRLLPILLALLLWAGPTHAQAPDSVLVSWEAVEALQNIQSVESPPNDAAASSQAAPTIPRAQAIFNVLFLFLALSLIFESAMSVIFDWRLFIRYFEGRGIKTPVIVGTAFLVFWSYDLDIVHDLLVALDQGTPEKSVMGQFLTALLIGGGSGGIFRIFARLGIRSPEERRRKAQKERADDATDSMDPSPSADAPDSST